MRFLTCIALQDIQHWPFQVVDKDGSPLIKVDYLGEEKTFTPQEISSMVLLKMKEISEAKLGKEVKKAGLGNLGLQDRESTIASSHISPLTSTCVVCRTTGPSLGTEVHLHFRRRPVQGYDVRPSFHLDAVSA